MLYETLAKEFIRRGGPSPNIPYIERRPTMLFEKSEEVAKGVTEIKSAETVDEFLEDANNVARKDPVEIKVKEEPKKEAPKKEEPKKDSKATYTVNLDGAYLVNIRKEPDPNSEVIGNYANGEKIIVDENFKSDNYYRTYNSKGIPGFILKKLVKKA